jgi:glycosyltransferase involved in cell wall biosynthesis
VLAKPRIAVLTTSYPRSPDDPAGRFIAETVERLRLRGVDVRVVAPGTFRDYGIASGAGVLTELRRPGRAVLLPLMLASFVREARRAARGVDLVHAHWLPTGAVALATGRPYVLHLHGSDIDVFARKAPRLAARLVRRARLVICVSTGLAEAARELGAREVRVIPNAVTIPAEVGEEADPPEVLFAGRLSREKGILELIEAARGLRLVVAGDGPLRARVPGALGFVSRERLEELYARAAVVACPSLREGFGLVCAEAMAHGRAVVASAVGGLLDLVTDGQTGVLVPPGDVAALRAALGRLLADRDERRRLGLAARASVEAELSWDRVIDLTLSAYEDARGAR